MKVDLSQAIFGLNGKPLTTGEKKEPLTYRKLITTCLDVAHEGENAEMKMKKFRLAVKCSPEDESKPVDLTLDERAMIKQAVDKAGSAPVVYGRISEFLEDSNGDNK